MTLLDIQRMLLANSICKENVMVFCTSLKSIREVQKLASILDENADIVDWSVDMEDADKVLRIVSKKTVSDDVLRRLENLEFKVWEMKD